MLTTCSSFRRGAGAPGGAADERGHSSCSWMLSLSSKPVNGFACRSVFDAPR